MNPDRSDVLDRFETISESPTPSFDAFLRKLDRRRRNKRVTAIVVAVVVFAVPAWMVAADIVSGRSSEPAIPGPPPPPGVSAVDQTLVDRINGCELLLVTPAQLESALGFRASPSPYELGGTPERVGVPDPLSTGCEYAALGWVPDLGEFLPRHDGPGGQLVITAYLADAPPAPIDRSDPVPGLGDAARFSPYGNGDEHLSAHEGATSVLEVSRDHLILRFNGGGFEVAGGVVVQHLTGYPLEPLVELAEGALLELDRLTGGEPTGLAYVPTSRERWARTVDGVAFTFRTDRSWAAGPITTSGGALRTGHLLISKSIAGPQGAEAVIFWTSIADGPAHPCGQWWGSPDGTMADAADAVATARGTALVMAPTSVTVGGMSALRVVVTVTGEGGCDPGFFYRWRAECWGPCWMESTVGDRISVWLVDVEGTRLFIAAETSAQADAALEREVERIVGSIRFGPG